MTERIWVALTPQETTALLDAISFARSSDPAEHAELDALSAKLTHGFPHPNITIGVYGGLVQWTRGNPFPIRICDYDGHDLPDIDERGDRCQIWFEPADEEIEEV
jgi:hypothetical protein